MQLLPQSEVRRGETVRGRARPDFDAMGQYVGSFVFYPVLEVEESYNSNIFADETGEVDDFITRVLPGVRVESDWARHQVVLEGTGDIGFYADNSDENYEDFRLGTAGRLDVYDGAYISPGVSFQNLHESRGSPDDVNGENPTEYDIYSADFLGFYPSGRFNFSLGGEFDRLDFGDVGAGPGLPDIDQDDRDRNIYQGSARVGYEIQPAYEAFIKGTYNDRDYDDTLDNEGFNRDSWGFDVVGGVDVDFGGLVFGEFFIGYSLQDYEDGALSTVEGVSGGADVTWNPTPLTTVNLGVRRVIEETTIAGASGFYATTGGLSVDHELLRSVILTVFGSVTQGDYEGIDRTDYTYTAGAEAKYFLNRFFFASAGYTFRSRTSDLAGVDDYDQHIGLVRLGAQY